MLGRAIFAITSITELPEDPTSAEVAVKDWQQTFKTALSDPLGGLIDLLGKAARENAKSTISNLDDLLDDLREAARIRNVLVMDSGEMPDTVGRSTSSFVNRKIEVFETPIDVDFPNQLRSSTVGMASGVINVVMHMGWQFPGASGFGKPVWPA